MSYRSPALASVLARRLGRASVLLGSLLLVAAPAIADTFSVTVRATADEPAAGDALPTTLVEPGDVAETPEPICTVCAIVTKPTKSSRAATFELRSADAFAGDVEIVVALDDGRQVSGRIRGIVVDPGDPVMIAVTPGTDWCWEHARAVWTRNHRTSRIAGTSTKISWDPAVALGARAVAAGDRGVALAATTDLAGDVTLVIVGPPDRATGRPARATATLDGIRLDAGDDLAIQIATSWAFDWRDVDAAWLELRTEPQAAAGEMQSEYRYVSIRR